MTHRGEECRLCNTYEHVRSATLLLRIKGSLGTAVLVANSGDRDPAQAHAGRARRVYDRVDDGDQESSGDGAPSELPRGALAVTNAHVVGDQQLVRVFRHTGQELTGQVVAMDKREDLALLWIPDFDAEVEPVRLDIDVPQIGSEVFAVGHPLGLGWTISRGIVSGLPVIGGRPMVQTDAPISPGNSGGALVDVDGHLVGIVTEKVNVEAAESLAFARPTGTVQRFLATAQVQFDTTDED